MDFEYSAKSKEWIARVSAFMDRHVYPNVETFESQHASGDRWVTPQIVHDLKELAKKEGLWNMFMPPHKEHDKGEWHGAGLTNLEYAPLAEIMGRVAWASEVFNCSAPDTGNMEVLHYYGTEEQNVKWLRPLMNGDIRSAFLMTEPAVGSSDATNIETRIERKGDEYVINGRKWWSSGAGRERCKVSILMGKTDPEARTHAQQSMVLVPTDTPGVTVVRNLLVFGYDDRETHSEVLFEDVRVPVTNLLGPEGGGFMMSQARLGPGRIHHCMRLIGMAERALAEMCARVQERVAFGKPIAEQGVVQEWIADSRIEIDQARLLTRHAAWLLDEAGTKGARNEISAIKVVAPTMACKVIDRAIQAFGGAGVSQDTPLAEMYAAARTLRLADGPDEVHRMVIARRELRKYEPARS